jgi:predicted aconitase
VDDSFWPLLGYVCGRLAGGRVPLILGLEGVRASTKDLQSFCAAFGTTAAAPLFHMRGHTPDADGEAEAPAAAGPISVSDPAGSILASELGGSISVSDPAGSIWASELGGSISASEPGEVLLIDMPQLRQAFEILDGGGHPAGNYADCGAEPAALVALGNPHASLCELEALAGLTRGRERHRSVRVIVTVGRHVLELASAKGYVRELERFGATLLSDTCWCMLGEPVVPPTAVTIVTNSAKYAHYAPGLTGRRARFTSLAGCVQAAVDGGVGLSTRPGWLVLAERRKLVDGEALKYWAPAP